MSLNCEMKSLPFLEVFFYKALKVRGADPSHNFMMERNSLPSLGNRHARSRGTRDSTSYLLREKVKIDGSFSLP